MVLIPTVSSVLIDKINVPFHGQEIVPNCPTLHRTKTVISNYCIKEVTLLIFNAPVGPLHRYCRVGGKKPVAQ